MKIQTFAVTALATVAMLTAQTGNRQVTQNDKSPSANTSVAIGGAHITIEYNAPSARGRKVEGGLNSLQPHLSYGCGCRHHHDYRQGHHAG